MHCFQKEYKHNVHRIFQTKMNTEDIEAIEVDATIEKLETVTETIAKLKREEDLLPKAELRKKWTTLINIFYVCARFFVRLVPLID